MKLSENEAKREVSQLIHMADAFHSTILYFPETFHGLNELFKSMKTPLYTLEDVEHDTLEDVKHDNLEDVRHEYNTHVRAAFIRESESFRSRLPR